MWVGCDEIMSYILGEATCPGNIHIIPPLCEALGMKWRISKGWGLVVVSKDYVLSRHIKS